jgi:DNA-binding NarL/FixJ family response regulator
LWAKRNRSGRRRRNLRDAAACVILDFRLIDGTGVDVMRAVHPALPEIRFVVLTNHPSAQYRRVCMDAGPPRFWTRVPSSAD